MTKKAEVVFEDNLFRLVKNSQGYWMWSRLLNRNIAMKAESEQEAYMQAIRGLSTHNHRILHERNNLEKILDKVSDIIADHED